SPIAFLGVVVGLVSRGMSVIIQADLSGLLGQRSSLIPSGFLESCCQSDWGGYRTVLDHFKLTVPRPCTDGRLDRAGKHVVSAGNAISQGGSILACSRAISG